MFVQNSPCNYELLEISVFCQRRKENITLCLTVQLSICLKFKPLVEKLNFASFVKNLEKITTW